MAPAPAPSIPKRAQVESGAILVVRAQLAQREGLKAIVFGADDLARDVVAEPLHELLAAPGLPSATTRFGRLLGGGTLRRVLLRHGKLRMRRPILDPMRHDAHNPLVKDGLCDRGFAGIGSLCRLSAGGFGPGGGPCGKWAM
jgi:hypothetical protein